MRGAAFIAVIALGLAGCAAHTPWARAVVAPATSAARSVPLEVTRHGFKPKHISVRAGEVVTLEITRRVERTCVTSVVISLDGDTRIERELPFDEPVALTLRFETPGELGMSCPMNMHGVTIEVR